MARFSRRVIRSYFARADAPGVTTRVVGVALEDLICYLISKIAGVEVVRRNAMNQYQTEEIDVAFFNARRAGGLHFLPDILLVECKNWSAAVGSEEVAWFDRKIEDRGLNFGILIAAKGITGEQENQNRAHAIIAGALAKGRRMLVITRNEIESLTTTQQLVRILKEKLCDLAVTGRLM